MIRALAHRLIALALVWALALTPLAAKAQLITGGQSGGGGSGTVTTTGSPASGNLAKFSAATSITNGDISGDCTTSGTLAINCTKTAGVAFGTAATTNTGTSGATIPLLNGNNTQSGTQGFTASTLPTQAAGTLGVAGGSTTDPTLAATDEGDVYLNTTNGFTVIGDGSTNDVTIENKSKTIVAHVKTGAATINIVGTNTNDNAAAGEIGEFVSSNVASGSAVSLTTATAANVTSVSLTAGDWDCFGNVGFAPNASTSTTAYAGWISTTSATLPTVPNSGAEASYSLPWSSTTFNALFPVGVIRLSLSGTTTVFLSAYAAFTVSTNGAYGFIGCRRVR